MINHLGEGGPSSCVISVGSLGCSYLSEHRALVLNSPNHKHFGGLLETVVGQRIWLFPVLLTAVRIDRRQDLKIVLQRYESSMVQK